MPEFRKLMLCRNCRKSRSPGKQQSSRSPSHSPFGSDENDRVNNNEDFPGAASGNSAFLAQKSIREREEEKRRLQAEMRRREQELLAKIKEQQRELENMKQEKGKVKVPKDFRKSGKPFLWLWKIKRVFLAHDWRWNWFLKMILGVFCQISGLKQISGVGDKSGFCYLFSTDTYILADIIRNPVSGMTFLFTNILKYIWKSSF